MQVSAEQQIATGFDVLVVDDDITTGVIASQSLTANGYRVSVANCGEQALQSVASSVPDAILLDVDMPGLDGYETCRRLRRIGECANLPIVMLTSYDDGPSIDQAYAAGATDFATKPINWTLLAHRLRYLRRAADTVGELSVAQAIAGLGSWRWLPTRDHLLCSDGMTGMLGIGVSDVTTREALLAKFHHEDAKAIEDAIDEARNGNESQLHCRVMTEKGEFRTVDHRIRASKTRAGVVEEIFGTLLDVTERQRDADRIHRLAYYDTITDLPNRRAFIEALERAIATAHRHHHTVALLYLDLDDFKRINDTLGHEAGDSLLRQMAERVMGGIRRGDLIGIDRDADVEHVARLGGDEFIICLPNVRDPHDVVNVATRILQAMNQPFHVANEEVFMGVSIGIALYPQDATDARSLVKNADVAMYSAKRGGKNCYQFFAPTMNAAAQQRLSMETQLRRAIERDEFSLHYQPQVELGTRTVSGLEALLRWSNPQLGSVPPSAFIPLAEDSGLILPLGEWVLREACSQMRRWRQEGVGVERIAVNISPRQFDNPTLVDVVREVLEQSGLDARDLELEITETALASDVEAASTTLSALRELGVRVAIDDFGTGYSNLSNLKRFPIDRLKIDRSFIRDIVTDPDSASIAGAITAMAMSMDLEVLAEGVETEGQLRLLRLQGCHEVQGYLLSRPVAANGIGQLLLHGVKLGDSAVGEHDDERRILFLDDDPLVLAAIQAHLEDEPYTVLVATDTTQAFEMLAAMPVQVVVSDERMPSMSGTEFLRRISHLFPGTVRMMLSGGSTMQSLIELVNSGCAHRFIEKPFNPLALKHAVREAFRAAQSKPHLLQEILKKSA